MEEQTLKALRKEMDRIDSQLVGLFCERMEMAGKIGEYKKERGLPVLDSARERQKITETAKLAGPEFADDTRALYALLFELSRAHESRLNRETTPLEERIRESLRDTEPLFPPSATVACQGVEGAYSQFACEKLFRFPEILYLRDFEHVFSAIESGLCRYGVIPLENSTAGSVNKVYDLMIEHSFQIVRSTRVRVTHNLMAKAGTALRDVREIFSHEQAISQCEGFLSGLKDVKVTACENTAAAAKFVAESDRKDVAALASEECLSLYGLNCLALSVQDQGRNDTRFICISKKPEIYPGADRTSIMMVLPNRPGSLYRVLGRFYALGINLIKLESRPIPERDFEFMFYFDLDVSVYSPEFLRLMGDLQDMGGKFRYLGSYSEVI